MRLRNGRHVSQPRRPTADTRAKTYLVSALKRYRFLPRHGESLRTLFAIDQVGSQYGKPSQEVIISDCGQLWPPHHTQQKKKFTSTSGARHKSEQGFVDYDW